MGLDLKKLRDMQKNISKKAGAGDSIFLFANKLGEEVDVRLLPTRDNMNGLYFLEQTGWWINGKMYIVDGDHDVIGEEIEDARALKDKAITALLDKKKDGMPLVKKETRYLIPVLLLKTKYDSQEQLESCEVDEVKILVAKPTLMLNINEVVTSRPYQNKTQWGMMDREKGYNMIIGKSGKGLDTKYSAIGWVEPMEMPEEYYAEDKLPDLLGMQEKALKSDEHLISVIRNYLYGEDIIEDVAAESEEEEAPKAAARPVTKSARPARTAPSAKATPAKVKPTGGRSILEDAAADMSDLDD